MTKLKKKKKQILQFYEETLEPINNFFDKNSKWFLMVERKNIVGLKPNRELDQEAKEMMRMGRWDLVSDYIKQDKKGGAYIYYKEHWRYISKNKLVN